SAALAERLDLSPQAGELYHSRTHPTGTATLLPGSPKSQEIEPPIEHSAEEKNQRRAKALSPGFPMLPKKSVSSFSYFVAIPHRRRPLRDRLKRQPKIVWRYRKCLERAALRFLAYLDNGARKADQSFYEGQVLRGRLGESDQRCLDGCEYPLFVLGNTGDRLPQLLQTGLEFQLGSRKRTNSFDLHRLLHLASLPSR